MSTIKVDTERLRMLRAELERLSGRLDLGQANYLNSTLTASVTGHAGVSDALDAFENGWDYGRDRVMQDLTRVTTFLSLVEGIYDAAEAAVAGQAQP